MIKAIHHHPINKSLQCKNNNCNKHCFLRVIWTRRTMLLWYDGKRCSIMKSRPSMYYQVPTTSVWVNSFWETNTPTDKWCLKYVGLFKFTFKAKILLVLFRKFFLLEFPCLKLMNKILYSLEPCYASALLHEQGTPICKCKKYLCLGIPILRRYLQ